MFDSGLRYILVTIDSEVFLVNLVLDKGQTPDCTATITRSIVWQRVHFCAIKAYAARILGGNPDVSIFKALPLPITLIWACARALTRSAKTRIIHVFFTALLPTTDMVVSCQ